MALRELATAWVRANCPRSDVQENITQHLDHAVQRGANCSFMIGRELTKSEKPCLVYCFRNEVFAFVLTPIQAARLNVTDSLLVCAESPRVNQPVPTAEPVVWLQDVEVDNAAVLDRSQPITGTLRYRTAEFITDPLAIHAVCEPPGRPSTILSHHISCLPLPKGAIRFSLPALGELRDAAGFQFTGLVPIFFQMWLTSKVAAQADSPFQHPSLPTPPSQKTAPPGPKPHQSSIPNVSPYITSLKPMMPAMSTFPPTYDPGGSTLSPVQEEKPVSDVFAVLVEIAE